MGGFLRSWQLIAPKRIFIAAGLVLLIAAGVFWSVQQWRGASPKPEYLATGVVVALLPPPSTLHTTRPVIIIYHDRVPGLMDEAMSMPFIADSMRLFDGLRPGDRIAFGLKETPEALLVVSIQRLTSPRGK